MFINRAEIEKQVSEIIGHFHCEEDPWYSCPMTPDGCADPANGTECNCGLSAKVSAIMTIIDAVAAK